jgi:ATP-dependent DNA ligase
VIASQGALDFEALLLRIHPAATRVELLARETPASFVAWDVLSLAGNDDVMKQPLRERRALLEQAFAHVQPPIHLTPFTRDSGLARSWFERFEGAGLDGVVAKRDDGPYVPGQRVMAKVKHARTADVVVAGFRYYAKGGKPRTDAVGSLVLGLFDAAGTLHHTGVAASFTMKKREELISFLAPYRLKEGEAHPWKAWAPPPAEEGEAEAPRRRPGMTSRWNRGKDLSWQPLRLELVAEVAFDHLQGDRFRHATHFQRWRSDKKPSDCTYDQLDEVAPQELADLFAGR